MSSILINTLLPAGYAALAQALNFTSIIPNDLSVLDSIKIDGKAAREWFESITTNFTLPKGSSTLLMASKFRNLHRTFPQVLQTQNHSMILAGSLFGITYVLDRTLNRLPLVKQVNPYLRTALALAGAGTATLFAAHNYLAIEATPVELVDLALRVSVVALGSKVVIRTTQTALRFFGRSSAVIAKAVSFGCKAAAGTLDFLVFPATNYEAEPDIAEKAPPAAAKAPPADKPADKDTKSAVNETISDDEV